MARPTDEATARTQRLTIRFTKKEIAALDLRRGPLSRAVFIRKLITAQPNTRKPVAF